MAQLKFLSCFSPVIASGDGTFVRHIGHFLLPVSIPVYPYGDFPTRNPMGIFRYIFLGKNVGCNSQFHDSRLSLNSHIPLQVCLRMLGKIITSGSENAQKICDEDRFGEKS